MMRQTRWFYKRGGVKYLEEIRPDHITDHLDWTTRAVVNGGNGLGHKSKKDRFDILHPWLDFAVERGWIGANPADGLGPGKITRNRPEFLLAEEVEKVLEDASNEDAELAAACAIAVYAGPRREEIHLMAPYEVNLETRIVNVKWLKFNDWRSTVILDQLVPYLIRLPRTGDRLIRRWKTHWGLGEAVIKHFKKALPDRERRLRVGGGRKRVDALQALRRTCVTWLSAHGVSAGTISDWVGHGKDVLERDYRGITPPGARPLPMTCWGLPLIPTGIPPRPPGWREATQT